MTEYPIKVTICPECPEEQVFLLSTNQAGVDLIRSMVLFLSTHRIEKQPVFRLDENYGSLYTPSQKQD